MDCFNVPMWWLLMVAALPMTIGLIVLTRMLWNMLRGNGGWK